MATFDYNQIQEHLQSGWTFNVEKNEIEKEFSFKDFLEALSFVNKAGAMAQAQDHHPNIFIHDYNQVLISVATHSAGGITENDFKLAAAIDTL